MNTIEINIDDDEQRPLLNDLMYAILDYYPMGFGVPDELYHGHKKLKEKISVKINQLTEEKLPASCELLVKETNEKFTNCIVSSELYKQFPNYSLSIELLKKESTEIDIVYKLNLRISLLTKHFTIFHEETSFHKNTSSKLSQFEPVKIVIISSSSLIADTDNVYFKSLINIVNQCFPDYKFVSHFMLFLYKTKGIPYEMDGHSLDNKYPLYTFLFDNEYGTMKNTYAAY